MSDITSLLKQIDSVSKEVSDLTIKLEAAKAKGRELVEQYNEYHSALLASFGLEPEPVTNKTKKASGGTVRWATTITRAINPLDAKTTKADALVTVRQALERLARKKGVNLPADVLADAERLVAEKFKK